MNWFVLPVRIRRWLLTLCAGASVYQMLGCSQEVSDILASGFTDASITLFSTLVEAFFTGLIRPTGGIATVTGQLVDSLPAFLG